jgi:hypothetical protein
MYYQGREIVLKRTERKIVAGAALAAGQDNFEDVKSIAAKVYTTLTLKATAAKLDFAACFRYAKCSFRVRLHKKYIRKIRPRNKRFPQIYNGESVVIIKINKVAK